MTQVASESGTDQPDLARRICRRFLAARRDWRIKGFLRSASTLAGSRAVGSRRAAVFVAPFPAWEQLPDYMITLALALRHQGIGIELIWDDTPFDSAIAERRSNARIGMLTKTVSDLLPVVRVSQYLTPHPSQFRGDSTIAEYARLNAYRRDKCEVLDERGNKYETMVRESLQRTAGALTSLLIERRPEYVLAGGGLYRSSCAVVHAGRQLSIRVATIDSGPGIMLLSTNGVAANLDDVPGIYSSLRSLDTEWDVTAAAAETSRRRNCVDQFGYQAVPAGDQTSGPDDACVLIALNQSFDTSALGRHCIYKNQTEWMLRSVEWLLANSSMKVVVRRHPVERKRHMRSNDDYEGLLAPYVRRYGARLHYISESAHVSTYDIMRSARIVLVHTSSVGMEATMLGVPVITQSRSAYASLGFVWHADTEERYQSILARGVEGALTVTDQMKADASRCYYITQCCNFVPTDASPSSLSVWASQSATRVLSSPSLQAVLDSVDSGTPLALTRYLADRQMHAT